MPPSAPPLQKALGLLLLPEEQLSDSSAAIRQQAAATPLAGEMDDVIAAILLSRFNGRSITDICAMGGITLDDFTKSVAYREIYGLGQQAEATSMILRQLQRNCGPLSTEQQSQIQALPLAELEDLAEALLDFQGAADLTAWLSQRQG
jgi:predicted transposase YdaD